MRASITRITEDPPRERLITSSMQAGENPASGRLWRLLAEPSKWALFLLPAVIGLLVYSNVFGNELIFDDPYAIGRANEIARGGLGEFFLTRRGLTWLSIYADVQLWGDWAGGYRIQSLLTHGLASGLAAILAAKLARQRSIGLLCGILFAVHPIHVEVVTSIENRKDAFAMVAVMLSMLAYLSDLRLAPKLALSFAFALIGVLYAKDIGTVGVLGMMLIYPLYAKELGDSRSISRKAVAGTAGLTAAIVLITLIAFREEIGAPFSDEDVFHETGGRSANYAEVLIQTFAGFPLSAKLAVFPLSMSADYPMTSADSLGDGRVLAGLALFLGLVAATFWLYRRWALGSFALAWALVMFLPTMNLVPLSHIFVADRYLYVPSFGICLLAAAWLAPRILGQVGSGPNRFATIGTVVLVIGSSVMTLERNLDWRSRESLFVSAFEAVGPTFRIQENLGWVELEAKRLPQAEVYLRQAVEIDPLACRSRYALGNVLAHQSKIDEAFEMFKIVADRAHNCEHEPKALQGMARCQLGRGQFKQAIESYQQSLNLHRSPDVLVDLSLLLGDCPDPALRNPQLAFALVSEAITHMNPPTAVAEFAMAISLARAGRRRQALQHANKALELSGKQSQDLNVDLGARSRALIQSLQRATPQK